MKPKLIIFIVLLGNTTQVISVFLTSTLITGLMGGFLLGRMNLETFVSLLSNNGSSSSVLNLPLLSTLIPREEEKKSASNPIQVSPAIMTPIYSYYPYSAAMPQNYYYYPNNPSPSPIQTVPVAQTPTQRPATNLDISVIPITPVDAPVSLDNKIRETFIRQLTLMDPLNCLPKIFCEVSADPYGTALALDHGTIAAVQPPSQSLQSSITVNKPESGTSVFEIHLHTPNQTSTTTTTTTTTPKPAKISENDDAENDKSESAEDDKNDSDSASNEDIDESYEDMKRKEEDSQIEMQAMEEMIDEVGDKDDPMMYYYILKDKERRKQQAKQYENVEHYGNDNVGYGFRDDFVYDAQEQQQSQQYQQYSYHYEEPSFYDTRRFDIDPPSPPSPPPPPPQPSLPALPSLFKLPSFFLKKVKEKKKSSSNEMFADDPFFDDFPTKKGRKRRDVRVTLRNRSSKNQRRGREAESQDALKNYREAYTIADKYRSPDMCRKAFPSCPYQTKTIMQVVNRLETGLLPFSLGGPAGNDGVKTQTNLDHFKNTLLAVERLNKATIKAQSRGGPLNLHKVTEEASSPTVQINAETSNNIIDEFQEVVTSIKTAKLSKKGKKKRKKNKGKQNFDTIHYYKKAQMDKLEPKEKIQQRTTELESSTHKIKTNFDEKVQTHRRKLDRVSTFKETYDNMFKIATMKTKPKPSLASTISITKRPEFNKPIRKFSMLHEDDEKDAMESEDKIFARISQTN